MSIYTCAIITVSDSCYANKRVDTAGPALEELLNNNGFEIAYKNIVPDDKEMIQKEVIKCVDENNISLVLTCGGTGFSKRDITPETVQELFDRNAPGFAEAMRYESFKITPKAVLSRACSGLRKESIIITLPGSKKAAIENISAILNALKHGIDMVKSSGSVGCGD